MAFPVPHSKRPRLAGVVLFSVVLLFAAVVLRIQAAQAEAPACAPGEILSGGPLVYRPTHRVVIDPTPTVNWTSAGTIERLCGRLVYLEDTEQGVKDIGLQPCGPGKPYIFKTHPRDIVDFYQFRDAQIYEGPKVCTVQFGCLDKYIYTFKNYIGIKDCKDCGMNVPPTWTQAPLTPYTPTPVPPTRTPYIPSPTPTASSTLSPDQVTATPNVFELLQNTPSLQPSSTRTLPPTSNIRISVTSTLETNRSQLLGSPLVVGIGFILIMLFLAYLVWMSTMKTDH